MLRLPPGADDGVRAVGANAADVGFAWSGRRRELGGGRQSIAKFRSTDTVRLASLAPRAALNDQRNLAPLTNLFMLTHARGERRNAADVGFAWSGRRRAGAAS